MTRDDAVLLDALRHTGQHSTAALLERVDQTRDAADPAPDEEGQS